MAGIGGLLGNQVLDQLLLYNVAGQLIGAALSPAVTAISSTVNAAAPLVPLSPADAADAVIRNVMPESSAAAEAAKAGIDADRFATLVLLAGNAPDPTSLAVALRRKLIDAATYDRGIRQGRLRDEWGPIVRELAVQQPSPEAMLAAYLEGQLPEAEARERYAQLGGDPDYFDILFDTQGQAPTPAQALELLNRGIIAERGSGPTSTSYEQAFLEGPWRNKWLGPFLALREYLPPPRTVTAMTREGALTHAQAAALFAKSGLSPELVTAYLHAASLTKTAKTKELSQSTVEALYRERLIPRAEAGAFLESLGYTAAEAELILELVDLQVAHHYLSTAVGRVHTLFVGHKIGEVQARTLLGDLKLDSTSIDDLVATWHYERAANIRTLTPAEIASAMTDKIVTQAEAQAMLEALGYLPHDAWIHLSVHAKEPLPDEPGANPADTGPTL